MADKIYIFGAHSRGRTLAEYLRSLYPDLVIEAFLYDNEEENPSVLDGVPVLPLKKSFFFHTENPVYIGTRGIYHESVTERLRNLGFMEIYPVTVELDLKLRNEYLSKYYENIGRVFMKIDGLNMDSVSLWEGRTKEEKLSEKSAGIYVARSVSDKPLRQDYELASYERALQVGAVLTEECIEKDILTDDTGEHISGRNKQFCELTGLYWVWKNAREDIVGLAHYRRHFILPDDWIERMLYHEIDVILPVPLYVAPSIEGNFKERHEAENWDHMMQYLQKKDPWMYMKANEFFRGNLYSPCNMLIARKRVLDELCQWLFPILFYVAECGGHKEDPYSNRYPGFIAERLITFFLEKNRNQYKLVYADKNFLPS